MYTEEDIDKAKEILKDSGYLVDGLWQDDDVIERAKERDIEVTEEEAREILAHIGRKWDANYGISWDTLDYYTDDFIETRDK